MTFFRKISLIQFRNYASQSFYFNKKIVSICGANGSGKTNLLDAIYYLCFTKSSLSKPDAKSAMHGTQGFRIDGTIELQNEEHQLTCILRETGKKEFYVDEEAVKKFSTHIGRFPCVIIEPDDISLITGASEERRRFLDTLLSQLDSEYLQQLINYHRILLQRNSCLKNMFEQQMNDNDLLDVLDEQLADCGQFIFSKRKQFLETLIPLIIQQYEAIANKDENITIHYQSQLLEKPLLELLTTNRQRDLYAQRTMCGIHKDDFILLMDSEPFRQVASQGQKKSLLFALKFAEFFAIQKIKKQSPILLLDDVFEKLDEERLMNLMQKVCNETNAQVFITDTHKARFDEAFSQLKLDYQLIEL